MLVLGLSTDTLAYEINPMAHVAYGVNARYFLNISFIISEIRVALYSLGHFLKTGAVFKFYIYHAAMYAFTLRDGHRQSVLMKP